MKRRPGYLTNEVRIRRYRIARLHGMTCTWARRIRDWTRSHFVQFIRIHEGVI